MVRGQRGELAFRGFGIGVFRSGVPLAFIHQAQPFHQQAGGGARDGRARGGAVEIDLEFAVGPADGLVDRFFAFDAIRSGRPRTGRRRKKVRTSRLARRIVKLAGFLAHFERLHQVENAHFLEAALDHAGAHRALLQLFKLQAVDHFFGALHEIVQEERLADQLLDAIDERAQLFLDVARGWREK